MQAPNFNMTTTSAANDGSRSAFLEDVGPYVGKILAAEYVLASTGTQGIMFKFKTKDGNFSPSLKIWVKKADGTELPGWGMVAAAKELCGITDALTPVESMVKRWNRSTERTQEEAGFTFPQFQGKILGFLLKHEIYTHPKTKKDVRRLAVHTFFHRATGQTYNEFSKNKPAQKIVELNNRQLANPVPDPALMYQREAIQDNQAAVQSAKAGLVMPGQGVSTGPEFVDEPEQQSPQEDDWEDNPPSDLQATGTNGPDFDDDIPF